MQYFSFFSQRLPYVFILVAFICGSLATYAAGPVQPNTDKVTVYTSWTPASLYFAARVDDPMVIGNQTIPLSQTWLDDAIAFYLKFHSDKPSDMIDESCLRVVISAAGGVTVQRGYKGEWKDDPSWFQLGKNGTIRYVVKVNGELNDNRKPDQGYQIELGLAWNLLKVIPPIQIGSGKPAPSVRFAVACYSQGETRSVSCWPSTMKEEDLSDPSTWGTLVFQQSLMPEIVKEPLASATLTQMNPTINGIMDGAEWMTAGVLSFTKQSGGTPPVFTPGRQSVSLLAAVYNLDPFSKPSLRQPLEPLGPWAGADNPFYHLMQIREVRRNGIDALTIEWPVGQEQEETIRMRFLAFLQALQEYDRLSSARMIQDAPLLIPSFDLSESNIDLNTPAGRQTLTKAIETYFLMTPDRSRLTIINDAGGLCYPVVLKGSLKPAAWNGKVVAEIASQIKSQTGITIGWITDGALPKDEELPGILSRCAWSTALNYQLGEGPIVTAQISPGSCEPTKDILPRRNGVVFENAWMKTSGLRPDLLFLNSWNDFPHGTEIAVTRQFGYQYADETKLSVMRAAYGRGFGVRLMRHNLPVVLRPGVKYPVEMLLKNGSVTSMGGREGFRIDYRIMRGDEKITSGVATEDIAMLELGMSRVYFTLSTFLDKRKPLRDGEYELKLDFRRNKVPMVTTALLTQHLGTLSIPFRVSSEGGSTPAIYQNMPVSLEAGVEQAGAAQVRNIGKSPWRKTALKFTWVNEEGAPVSVSSMFHSHGNTDPGALIEFKGKLPSTPATPGWYLLKRELTGIAQQPIALPPVMIQVVKSDIRAQFLSISLPSEIKGDTPAIIAPIAVKNVGKTAWTKEDTQIIYQWLAWDGAPIAGAAGSVPLRENVKSGGATTQRIEITPPNGAGSFRCAFSVESGGQKAILLTAISGPVKPLSVSLVRPSRYLSLDLSEKFNDWCSHPDNALATANMDGDGNALPSEEMLPDITNPPLGYKAGYFSGIAKASTPSFRFAQFQRGRAPMIRSKGQTIKLPDTQATALYLVATNTGDDKPVELTIIYDDDEFETKTIHISHWLDEPQYNEPVILRTSHIQTPDGNNWDLQGTLYEYSIPLDGEKKPVMLELPDQGNICIFAITLETPDNPQKAVPK